MDDTANCPNTAPSASAAKAWGCAAKASASSRSAERPAADVRPGATESFAVAWPVMGVLETRRRSSPPPPLGLRDREKRPVAAWLRTTRTLWPDVKRLRVECAEKSISPTSSVSTATAVAAADAAATNA